MKTLVSHVQQHARIFCRRPVAVALVLLGLTAGIGAGFGVFNRVWTGVHVARAGASPGLLMVSERQPNGANSPLIFSPGDFDELRRGNVSFAEVAAYDQKYAMLQGSQGSKSLLTTSVSSRFFALLDIQPELGRAFGNEENQFAGESVVILSQRLWKELFAAEPQLAGQIVTLDKKHFRVVGVMPEGFQFPDQTDLWVPLQLGPLEKSNRTSYYLNVLARLKPSVTLRQAQAELRRFMQRPLPLTALHFVSNVLLDPVYDHLKGNLQTL